ncbi:MAG: oligoendopeptidase F [Pseudomonadales bacterium]|nr:oligoendopeptidase F [Pseudomonadales bacterium]
MKNFLSIFSLALVCLCNSQLWAQETVRYEWDLSDIYPDVSAWEAAMEEVAARIEGLPDLQGSLGDSASAMLAALREISDTNKETARVYVYTSLERDADQRQADTQARFGRARQLYTDFGEATSWLSPEVLEIGAERVNRFIAAEPGLADFEFMLQDMLRRAPHTLDQQTEAILAQAGMVLSSPEQIYENYANADIPWPTITLSEGQEVTLSQAGYSRWRAAPNRDDRKLVFDTFWDTWNQFADGMGATLASEVQANVFTARVRSHDGVLDHNLFNDGLPPEVYTQLVSQVNEALPIFHRYLQLRGRMLGIDDLRYYDIYPPLVEVDTGEFDLRRSEEITFAALEPFGERYLELLEYGLSQDWMHSHPQPGKRSGAYMNGSVYDVHPYVLLNHNDDYNSLSTFAHEWGHAVHSLLANENNPYENAGYSTFIAEMASTINEILLEEYMIANARTDEEKLFYLGGALESIRGTFFRQTMFAEFELAIHQAAENGEPLTGPRLTEIYGDLLKRYHGHDEGVLTIDEPYAVEWAYIPHFYYDFYVFQYATSISGAAWFAEQFLAGDTEVRDDFIRVLSAGGSDYPHNILLNEAGLDMTQPEAYEPVLRRMTDLMDRIEALL